MNWRRVLTYAAIFAATLGVVVGILCVIQRAQRPDTYEQQ